MDVLTDPALTHFLWVLVLVLASLVVWGVFICCSGQDLNRSWDRLQIETKRPLKIKVQNQKPKKSKVKNNPPSVSNEGAQNVKAASSGQKSSYMLKKRMQVTKPAAKAVKSSSQVTTLPKQKDLCQQD